MEMDNPFIVSLRRYTQSSEIERIFRENNFGMVDLANYEDSLLLLAMGFGISDLLIVHKLLLLMKINLTEDARVVKAFEGTAHIALTNGWSFVRSSCKVQTASKISETMGKFNKIILPLAVAGTVITAGASIYKDYGNGTSRNTVKTCVGIGVSLGGGVGGSVAGATAGTVMLPGIGTIIGGIIGGIAGAFSGEYCSNALVDEIGDLCEYDIIKVRCSYCNYNFKLRKYLTNEEEYYCPVCNHRNV